MLIGLPLVVLLLRSFELSPWLTNNLQLTDVSPDIRELVSYILFVPFGALVVVFFRMTLGVRLMGPFRSILLAVAFQATGVLLGLFFLLVVVTAVLFIRPLLKTLKMPYYARTSFLLGTVAGLIIATLLVARWIHVTSLERVAFFPIFALCLTGDGFARTSLHHGFGTAAKRALATVCVAIAITLTTYIPGFADSLAAMPELLLLQVGLIMLISEFLDLRLVQRFLTRETTKVEQHSKEFRVDESAKGGESQFRVAVVRNRSNSGVIAQFGKPCPEVYGKRTVQQVLDGLRAHGFHAKVFEADMTLMNNLQEFLGPHDRTGLPRGLVFNMGYGIQGEARYTHVPAMLEMSGVPYTGASPLGHAVSLDKVVTKILMQACGVPTPRYTVMSDMNSAIGDLRFPLIVKPRQESTSFGLKLVRNHDELRSAVADVITNFSGDALVEEFIDGREVCVALLGNEQVETLPIVELDFGHRSHAMNTYDDKYHKSVDEPRKVCPANIDEALADHLRELAIKTFRACFCKDYARVDIRIDRDGNPFVLEINSMASLGSGGCYVHAAKTAGYDFDALIARIIDTAHQRYFGTPAPRTGGPLNAVPSAQPSVDRVASDSKSAELPSSADAKQFV